MATRFLSRSLLSSTRKSFEALLVRSFSSLPLSKQLQSLSSPTVSLFRRRPLIAVAASLRDGSLWVGDVRSFSTRQATSSLNDPNPNWSNRPPKETILLDGCDFQHWLVVVEKPDESWTRDQIIDSYIKTLAQVVGSEEEARMKLYSVSTRHYFAFGALVSEELSYKLKELPEVRWVLPDSYLDVRNKDYGGEPVINGQAVPYDPKYHEEWLRNSIRGNFPKGLHRRHVRPRDHSGRFDQRRVMQENPGGNTFQGGPNNPGFAPPRNQGGMVPNNAPNSQDGDPSNPGGAPYQSGPGPNQNSYAPNMSGGNHYQGNNMNGVNRQYGNVPNSGTSYQSGPGPNQQSYAPNMAGGNPYQNSNNGIPNNALNALHGNPHYGGAPY